MITSACASLHMVALPQGGTASMPVRENTPERAGLRSAHPVSRLHHGAESREKRGTFRAQPRCPLERRTRRWRKTDSNSRSPLLTVAGQTLLQRQKAEEHGSNSWLASARRCAPRQQPNLAAVQPGMHPTAVELDFV